MKQWNGQCHRCGSCASGHIMSMYNDELICLDCNDAEMKRPDYKQACEAELEALKSGDYNFKGSGL